MWRSLGLTCFAMMCAAWCGGAAWAGSNCCGGNGTPGCDDPACQAQVCSVDPFCCDIAWDALCGDQADVLCDVCQGGSGDCCLPNGTPGCDDPACEAVVCLVDPFCCDIAWDNICAEEAQEGCAVCDGGKLPAGACCLPGGGCEILTEGACENNPFNGVYQGDGTTCDDACGPGDCCAPNGTPGCDDPICEALVCGLDPFCCDVEWDEICAEQAGEICVACGGAGPGGCCAPNGTPGCDDSGCQALICGLDPFCCDVEWDGTCAKQANLECSICAEPPCNGGGDCCAPNGGPGCAIALCCDAVCAVDPFCCNVEWDDLCVDQAEQLCVACGAPGMGDCCAPNGAPGCDEPDCQSAVCAAEPACCEVAWDEACAALAADLCPACVPAPACSGEGDCCAANGTPGCEAAACCDAVCAVTPSCCDAVWDEDCAAQAVAICGLCPCPPDLDGDGGVGSGDLNLLLGSFGKDDGGDIDGDGVTDAIDLNLLLGAFGGDGCGDAG